MYGELALRSCSWSCLPTVKTALSQCVRDVTWSRGAAVSSVAVMQCVLAKRYFCRFTFMLHATKDSSPALRFLCPVFSASRVQHVSVLHPKFALRPYTMCGSMTDIQSAEIRRGKKELECGPMPNVMVALPNTARWRPLFNAAKFG